MLQARAVSFVFVLVLAGAVASWADGPDPDYSFVHMLNGGKGLATCPAGDASPYSYIVVRASRDDLSPIEGLPASAFYITLDGIGAGSISVAPYDEETDPNGEIRFQAHGEDAVPYGSITVTVRIDTVAINDSDLLWCNTLDYDANGSVNASDFATFASDFGGTSERSDFDWDGEVTPIDFGAFAPHYGH